METSSKLDEIVSQCIERSRIEPSAVGNSITMIMEEQKNSVPFLNVPVIVKQACTHILNTGHTAYGLFERANDPALVDGLKESYEDDGKVRLSFVNVLDIAMLLKEFLFALPNPLLGDNEEQFETALAESFTDPQDLRDIIRDLPKDNQHTLREIFYTFAICARNKYGNLTVDDMIRIWGKGTYLSKSLDSEDKEKLFETMMMNFEEIFADFNPFDNPNEGSPKQIYLENGKLVKVKISGQSLEELKQLAITGGGVENDPNLVFYKVEDHHSVIVEDVEEINNHPSLFLIPRLVYKEVEFPDITEEIEDVVPVQIQTVVKPVMETENGEAVPYLIWVFLKETSFRAKDWDPFSSEEADMFIEVINGEVFCNIIPEARPDDIIQVRGANIYQVFDSSRYFIFKERNKKEFVGIGFYNREESSTFRIDLATKMFEYSV